VSVAQRSGGDAPSPRSSALSVPRVLAPVLLAAAWGCGRELPPAPPVPHDTTAPFVHVVYPPPDSGTLYDRDSNGLVDLEVTWDDSGSLVVPASVRVTCAPECLPGLTADTNLAAGWRVVRRDTAGLVLEETAPLLLREGVRTLTVTVADTAGNVSGPVRVPLVLPTGAFHRAISLAGRPSCQPERGVNLVLTPDGRKGFAPYHGCLAVFDPEGVTPTHFIEGVPNTGWAAFIDLDTATGLAYIAGGGTETLGFTVLDTRTEQVVGQKTFGTPIASVAVDGDRLFAGESCTDGRIHVIDKRTLTQLGTVMVGAVSYLGNCVNSAAFTFTSDHRVGWAGVVGAGLVRFDPVAMTLLNYYDLEPSWDGYFGNTRDIALIGDHWLYLARVDEGLTLYQDAPWFRLAQFDGGNHPAWVVPTLAVSPDQHWLVVNVTATAPYGGVWGSTPRVYEVPMGLTLRYVYPPQLGHVTDAVTFHPDGKRFYVMAEYQVNVYLLRPR
jgi:hypothetical protein